VVRFPKSFTNGLQKLRWYWQGLRTRNERKEGARNERNKLRFNLRSRLRKHTWEAKALSTRLRLHVMSITKTQYQELMNKQKYKLGSKLRIGWRMEMGDGAGSEQKSRHKVKWNRDKLEWKLEPGQGTSGLSTIGKVKPSLPYLMKRVACHDPNSIN
jgi:hypothetical protein